MAGSLDQLRVAVSDRYAIERELGRGATAIVYLAEDLKHKRKVAVKVLNPELALAVRSERFLREIQIAAQLNHPHILPLHDSGDANGTLFYVMPYVEGESLRNRLVRENQLSIDDALRITGEVAEALAYAHKQGFVHRDIKPENILVHEGHALVADFGIARALQVAGGQEVTETGIAVGTPAYMSPEQASASEKLDGRSDIYSLACVLYEMLVGHPPYQGATAAEVLSRHTLDPLPSVRAGRRGVPGAVERALTVALGKQAADRFPSAEAFARALSSGAQPAAPGRGRFRSPAFVVPAVLGIVLVVAAVLTYRRGVTKSGERSADDNSIAVLPCTALNTSTEDEFFSQGMSEEILGMLSDIPGLRVAAFTSSLAVKNRHLAPRELGSVLGVAYVLDCSVRRFGGRLRVHAWLMHAADEVQVWQEQYDRELTAVSDAIAVQEEIAQSIAGALPLKADVRQAEVPTTDTLAYVLYLRGQYLSRTPDPHETLQAIATLDSAIKRDTAFALAYSTLSRVYSTAANNGYLPRQEAFEKSRAAALAAVRLNDSLAEAHAALGNALFRADWDWEGASRELRRAIQLNPTSGQRSGHGAYGYVLAILGRHDEAVREARQARRLNPVASNVVPGVTFMLAGRFDEAIAELRGQTSLEPGYAAAHGALCRAYLYANRVQEAVKSCEASAALRSRTPELAYAYAKAGRRDEADSIAKRLEEIGGTAVHGALAWAYVGLGEHDKAVRALVIALENREVDPRYLVEPVFAPIRDDPRFVRVRQRYGLP